MVEDREVGTVKKKIEKDIFLYVEVWEDNFGLDALLGTCAIPVKNALLSNSGKTKEVSEC